MIYQEQFFILFIINDLTTCLIKELFLSRYQKGNIQYELYRYSKTDESLTVVAGLDNNVCPFVQQQLKN
jgi:hypothetical protein